MAVAHGDAAAGGVAGSAHGDAFQHFSIERSKGMEIFRASPTIADGKIYSIGERGTAVVQNLADGKVLERIPMGGAGDATRSSIAVSDGHLFIRTSEKLWCIGK